MIAVLLNLELMLTRIDEILIKLKEVRKSKGISQEDIAIKLGVTIGQYSNYETGRNKISLEMFIKVLEILGVNIDAFLEVDKNISKEKLIVIRRQIDNLLE